MVRITLHYNKTFLHYLFVDIKPQIDKTKEPDLNNFVPEYDLKLFRDAQALASEKIEEELKSLPSTKGTFILIHFSFFFTPLLYRYKMY